MVFIVIAIFILQAIAVWFSFVWLTAAAFGGQGALVGFTPLVSAIILPLVISLILRKHRKLVLIALVLTLVFVAGLWIYTREYNARRYEERKTHLRLDYENSGRFEFPTSESILRRNTTVEIKWKNFPIRDNS